MMEGILKNLLLKTCLYYVVLVASSTARAQFLNENSCLTLRPVNVVQPPQNPATNPYTLQLSTEIYTAGENIQGF